MDTIKYSLNLAVSLSKLKYSFPCPTIRYKAAGYQSTRHTVNTSQVSTEQSRQT